MHKIVLILALLFFTFTSFSQDVFDIGVRKIEIFFNEPTWDDILDLYYANDIGERLIADSILIDGVMDDSVGVKYKGNSSYNVNNTKNPMNIKLDYIRNGQSIDGYNVLKLSNGFKDTTLVREVLSYEIAREYMPSSKATYANVYINGNWNGIYTCITCMALPCTLTTIVTLQTGQFSQVFIQQIKIKFYIIQWKYTTTVQMQRSL